MNPDKLFDYLDGKLPEHERHRLEEQLMNDAEARREFDVARRIHAATGGGREHLEVVDEVIGDRSQGKRAVRQILLATLVLVAVNVFLGLLYIAHHESTNPNRALLDQQNREELRQALDRAAADALTPPPLGVTELNLTVEKGREQAVADEIVQLTKRLKGTATAGIPDDARMKMLVELGGERSQEFRDALQNLDSVKEITGNMHGPSGANRPGNISVVVQLTETK